jgi:SAM-dependent methyltransferase
MNIFPVLVGLSTYLPPVHRMLARLSRDAPKDAAYCYGVWLRHLTLLWQDGMREMPASLAELGPGDSLGVGIAALLSGVDHYAALDVVRHVDPERSLAMLDAIAALLARRAARPKKAWPDCDPLYGPDGFPGHILTPQRLERALAPARVEAIRRALAGRGRPGDTVSVVYHAPFDDPGVIAPESVDVVVSQAVLEHVVDLDACHRALYAWLRPGGLVAHHVDLKSHGISREWNGPWEYSPFWWRLVVGKKPYLLNRVPCSGQLAALERAGFEIVSARTAQGRGIGRDRAAASFRGLPDSDFLDRNLFCVARKPARP